MRQILSLNSSNAAFRRRTVQPLWASILALLMSSAALAQAPGADPHHPDQAPAQAASPAAKDRPSDKATEGAPAAPGARGMGPGMMGQQGMGPGMMGQQGMMSGMMGSMMPQGTRANAHVMKMVFILADTNEDGALSFEEISAVHKRVFNRIDADKDGKVTIEEVQKFFAGN